MQLNGASSRHAYNEAVKFDSCDLSHQTMCWPCTQAGSVISVSTSTYVCRNGQCLALAPKFVEEEHEH
jgi:hypothetical protein